MATKVTRQQLEEARHIGHERGAAAKAAGQFINPTAGATTHHAMAPYWIARRKALLEAFNEGWATGARTSTTGQEEDDVNVSTWCEDCGARLDTVSMCPSCIPNSERSPDELGEST